MKRYMLFMGEYYYPLGGMNDFHIDGDTEQELRDKIKSTVEKDIYCEWWHIYDTEKNEIIAKSEIQGCRK